MIFLDFTFDNCKRKTFWNSQSRCLCINTWWLVRRTTAESWKFPQYLSNLHNFTTRHQIQKTMFQSYLGHNCLWTDASKLSIVESNCWRLRGSCKNRPHDLENRVGPTVFRRFCSHVQGPCYNVSILVYTANYVFFIDCFQTLTKKLEIEW